MKTWADFIPYVSMRLPSCPTFVMEDAAKRAAIDYFNLSRAWRVDSVTLATTIAGQAIYTVTNPDLMEMVGLPAVWVNDKEAREAVGGEADDYYPTERGQRLSIGVVGVDKIRVSPLPDTSGQVIKATVAYRPSLAATGIDDELWHAYRETIVFRMLSQLMMDIGKPWSDPKMAQYYSGQYDSEGLNAASDAGPYRRTPLRVKPSSY